MHRTCRKLRPVVSAFALAAAILAPPAAQAEEANARRAASADDPVTACERAARQSLATKGAPPAEVTFNAMPALQPGPASDTQMVLRGAGRWRDAGGSRSFDYTCNVDPRVAGSVGVVLRDTTPAARGGPARPTVEPNLSHVSPEACESSAAEALAQRWPRVSQISFDRETRSLAQESTSRAKLHGRGRALPEPGSQSSLFGYDCELDPRDGRVLSTRVSG